MTWAERRVRATALAPAQCLLWWRISILKLTLPPSERHRLVPFLPFLSSSLPTKITLMQTESMMQVSVWVMHEVAHMANTFVLQCRTHIGHTNTQLREKYIQVGSNSFHPVFLCLHKPIDCSYFCSTILELSQIFNSFPDFNAVCLLTKSQKQVSCKVRFLVYSNVVAFFIFFF